MSFRVDERSHLIRSCLLYSQGNSLWAQFLLSRAFSLFFNFNSAVTHVNTPCLTLFTLEKNISNSCSNQRLKKKFPASCSLGDIEENLSVGENGENAFPRLEYLNSRVEVVLWCVGNGKRLCGQAGLGPVWEPAPQTPFRRIGHIFWQEYALSILIERKDVLDFYWIEEEVTLNTW